MLATLTNCPKSNRKHQTVVDGWPRWSERRCLATVAPQGDRRPFADRIRLLGYFAPVFVLGKLASDRFSVDFGHLQGDGPGARNIAVID